MIQRSYFRWVAVALAIVSRTGLCEEAADSPSTFWTTGAALMPTWGFYPNGSAYGGRKPLSKAAAWTAAGPQKPHRLTWVADFPTDETYHIWVRRYGGYGRAEVTVDEKPLIASKGGERGARYVWRYKGTAEVRAGAHHVDIVASGMFDAILFTVDGALDPATAELPKPVDEPKLRAMRTYRDDSDLRELAGANRFVIGTTKLHEQVLYDWLPARDQIVDSLTLWGAADQYINGTFLVRNLNAGDRRATVLTASLTKIAGPGEVELGEEQIDLRVVHVRERKDCLFTPSRVKVLVPELLLRRSRTRAPRGRQGGFGGGECSVHVGAHESRQFWLTVHVPAGSPPGDYRGEIRLTVQGDEKRSTPLPLSIEVLPIDLEPPEGYYSIYYPVQPIRPGRSNYLPPEPYLAALEDMARHGLNAVTLYGGFGTLKYAKQAGLTKAPCLMHWPDSTARSQVNAAKQMGFDDLYYYGVDEPRSAEQVERCRKEAERRLKLGLHMMTAINSRAAQEATRDFIDRPVYNLYVFGGDDNAAARYVREKGFRPISYWVTATSYPLWYRAMTGLYNRACGYLGSAPWAYTDYPDERIYAPDKMTHRVVYPDEDGLPIPTLAWEAHRAGIDDVRYLEALERTIAVAESRAEEKPLPALLADALAQAREVRRTHYESIKGRWFRYLCSIKPGDLERTRREMADAVLRLNGAMSPKPKGH